MKIDSGTIFGSIVLFIVTSIIVTFILSSMNPAYLQKPDKKINILKTITVSSAFSFIFTTIITIISLQVDKSNLQIVKKSSC